MTVRTIDLFAGAGGFTTGAQAAGARVLWAANHWADAVEVHAANHPSVVHTCQDLQQADWRLVPDHDLLLASPACQGHSEAGQPGRWRPGVLARQQADRNTAWAVVACAETKRPRTVIIENVEPFLRWPLLPAFTHALELLGYVVRRHVFDAADFGVPQNRRRAIITARLGEPLALVSPRRPWRPFRDAVDWSSHSRGWAPIASKSRNVQDRIANGRRRGLGETFLTQHVTNHPGRSLDRPIGTLTTKANWALVDGDRVRMLNTREHLGAMDFPADYRLPRSKSSALRMLGNAIPPTFAADLVRQAIAG